MRKAKSGALKTLRILADTSLVEIYLNRGETVFATRFYPERPLRVRLDGDVKEARLWKMRAMQVRLDLEKEL